MRSLPKTGGFTAYKKVWVVRHPHWPFVDTMDWLPAIATLWIPPDAKRICGTYHHARGYGKNGENKCRADKAVVEALEKLGGPGSRNNDLHYSPYWPIDDDEPIDFAVSKHDPGFVYIVGETVRPLKRFSSGNFACASGIHFFMTRAQAEAYNV